MSKKNLDRLVESVIFENYLNEDMGTRAVAPGTLHADPVLGNTGYGKLVVKKNPETTVGEELPLAPSSVMSAQLADELPPVDDPDYKPKTASDFGLAMHAIVNDLPEEQMEKLYRSIRRTAEKMLGRINEQAGDDYYMGLTDEELFDGMTDEEKEELQDLADRMRASGEKVPASWDTILTSDDPINKIKGSSDEKPPGEIVAPVEVTKDGMTLEDLADVMGIGVSGARQSIEKLIRRTGTLERILSPKDLKSLEIFATIQFIKGLTPFVDEDDIDELKLNRDITRGLDSYRFFFVNSFILPVYNKLYRTASKDIEARLVRSGFPKRSALTIKNIMFGESMMTPEKLRNKIQKDIAAEDSSADVDTLIDRLKGFYPTLKSIASLDGADVAGMARDRWDKLSDKRKSQEVEKALDATQAFQDEFEGKDA
mgnify:FL=1